MNKIKEDEIEIDLVRLTRFYLKSWKSIALCCVVAMLVAIIWTTYFLTPMYKASATLYVNNTKDTQLDMVTGGNLTASVHLATSYVNIIKSKPIMEQVIRTGNLDCTVEQLRSMLTAKQIDETEILVVTVEHPDPEQAAHIVNTLAQVAPARLATIVEGSSAKIVELADPAEKPFTPNIKRNAIWGFLLGGVLMGGFLTIRYLFDMRVETEDDVGSFFEFPLLGAIPEFEEKKGDRA